MVYRQGNLAEILELLWTFTTVQRRMILQECLTTRQAGRAPSLLSLARDAILVLTATNNTERLAWPQVEMLGKQQNLPQILQDLLLATYSERIGEA